MSEIHVEDSIQIDRPVQEVFSYIADTQNIPESTAVVVEVRTDASAAPLKAGDKFTVAQNFLGAKWESLCEILALEENRFSYRSVGGPIPFTFTHTCEPSAAGTRLTVVAEGDPGTFFRLAGPLFERAARRQIRSDLETVRDLLTA